MIPLFKVFMPEVKEELKKLRELVSSIREKKVALADIDISLKSLEVSKSKMHRIFYSAAALFSSVQINPPDWRAQKAA